VTPAQALSRSADHGQHFGFEEPLDQQHETYRRDQQHQRRDRGDLIISGEARREHGEREGGHVRGAGKLVERPRKTKMAIPGYARAPVSTLARGR